MALAIGLAHAGNLTPCTATGTVAQEQETGCLVPNPGGNIVVTASYLNDPTFVNTPVTQSVDDYQTTITGLLNGGTTVYQQTFNAPFNDVSVQNAIALVNAMLTADGATFGSPLLTSNSTTLQSSVLSYVATSPTFDIPTLIACASGAGPCSGVTVTITSPTPSPSARQQS
jgi:hypothetical protein